MRGLVATGQRHLRPARLAAAVEHGHRIVACPFEHPPQPPAVVGALAVIHHGLYVVGKPTPRATWQNVHGWAKGWRLPDAAGLPLCHQQCRCAWRTVLGTRFLSRSAYTAPGMWPAQIAAPQQMGW